VEVIVVALGLRSLAVAASLGSLLSLAAASPPPRAAPLAFQALAGWAWPLQPAPDRVVRDFDPPAQPWLAGNRGVDLAGTPGERVRAAGAGVVSYAGTIAHIGVVSVTSGALRTTYEPLRVKVHRGQQVAAGAVLGTLILAGSHCLPAVCLHWGLLRGDAYLDPLALLGLEQVRLLPLGQL
jgi:murein DD-endopeptidase MepM/ murein hydrolase activator NlpD